ncbi:hypothetical protein pqer_cds_211 [Pandoravirus quercus]|uniref:Uncharacterized protein n=1 Tax=Pandoravirus quercus TaxID=2107709 RepID=A0A2U7U879_9VIRU|nr:hypothetical protein pqer_cds_211 [Pandoravirus quercus]AVK74633.1 hypothetical protein pqer_cds_211 [Pandoravirus quercus]
MSANAMYFDPVAQQRNAATAAAIEQARQQRAVARAQSPIMPAAASNDVFIIVDGGANECPGSPALPPHSPQPAPLPQSPVMVAAPPPSAAAAYIPQSPIAAPYMSMPPYAGYAPAYAPYMGAPTAAGPYYAPAIAAAAAAASAHGADAARAAGVVAECRPDARPRSCVWPWIILLVVLALLAVLAWRYFAQHGGIGSHHHHHDKQQQQQRQQQDDLYANGENVERRETVRSVLTTAPPASWTRLVERANFMD